MKLTLSAWMAMLDRIAALEAKCKALENQQQENYDDLVSNIPTLTEDGKLEAKVFAPEEGYEFVTIPFEKREEAVA